MRYSELDLNTVYADRDGRPIALVSLDKFAKPTRGYGSRRIRPLERHDRSFGVVAVRPASYVSALTPENALAEATRQRADFPERERVTGGFDVFVCSLATIVRTWDDHLIVKQAEAERARAAAIERREINVTRAAKLERIKSLLPAGTQVAGAPERNWVTISLDDLLSILER